MFYDTSQPIRLGSNQIAESAQFFIQGSSIPTSSTSSAGTATTTTPSTASSYPIAKSGLSVGAAAGIGVIATIAVVLLCLLVGYYCFYRRRQGHNNINNTHSTPTQVYTKHELEDRHSRNDRSSSIADEDNQRSELSHTTTRMNDRLPSAHHEMASTAFVAPPSNINSRESPPVARHEMQDYSRADRHAEVPRMGAPQVISRKELPSSNHHEMQDSLCAHPVSSAINRKELPAHHRPMVQDPPQQGQGLRSVSPQELQAGSGALWERIRE
jgi:hypothetical protein